MLRAVKTDGRIAPRSGLAVKKGIATGAGVIDADYRGQVMVLLFNHGEEDFKSECALVPLTIGRRMCEGWC